MIGIKEQNLLRPVFILILTIHSVKTTIHLRQRNFTDYISLSYDCVTTDFSQFQRMFTDKTDVSITFTNCTELCQQSFFEGLFVYAINLLRLHMSYDQGNIDLCSSIAINMLNNTFEGLTFLQELYMEGFGKIIPDTGIFHPLRNLQTLSLVGFGVERLNYSIMSQTLTGLSGTPIEYLELNGIVGKLNTYPSDLNIERLFQIQNASVKYLAFDNNIVPQIMGRLSKALPYLKYASISVQFQYSVPLAFIADALTSLIDIEELHIYSYPEGIISTLDFSKFNVQQLDRDIKNKIFDNFDPKCHWNYRPQLAPNLRVLRVNGLRFLDDRAKNAKLCFKEGNVLEQLDLSYCPLPNILLLVDGLKNLSKLQLKNTSITSIATNQWEYIPALKFLDVGGNDLSQFTALNTNLLQYGRLEFVNLTQCNLHMIPSVEQEIRSIDLSQNQITGMDMFLENSTNLTFLDVSENYIETLSDFALVQLNKIFNRNQNFVIDLQKNPLSCLCNATNFVKWMQKTGDSHIFGYSEYSCLQPNGSQVPVALVNVSGIELQCSVLKGIVQNGSCPCNRDILVSLTHIRSSLLNYRCKNTDGKMVPMNTLDPDETIRLCKEYNVFITPAFLVPIIVGTLLVTGLSILLIVLYRLKKKHKYIPLLDCLDSNRFTGMLMALLYRTTDKRDTQQLRYDAFVYFHDDDLSRIRESILNKLMSQATITTNYHFELGAGQVEEIDRSIRESRWIVFLISSSFVTNDWCRETVIRSTKLQYAIIPILLDQLDLQQDELYFNLINTNVPIHWSQNPEEQERICRALVEKIKSDSKTAPIT